MNMKFAMAVLSMIAMLVFAPVTMAQADRTWVSSGVGDDVNPCSITAPCRTFVGAISKTAAGGEINVLDPGGYGGVSITKSITIDGGGGQIAGILAGASNAIFISAAPTDKIILRNIQLKGLSDSLAGIVVLGAGQVHVDHVNISGFSAAISVEPTANPVSVMIERTRMVHNTVGLSVNGTGAAATVRLSDSTVQQNTTGLAVTGGGQIISFNNNRLAGNGTDGAPTLTIYQR